MANKYELPELLQGLTTANASTALFTYDKDLFNQIATRQIKCDINSMLYLFLNNSVQLFYITLWFTKLLWFTKTLYLSSIHQLSLPLAFKWVSGLITRHFRVVCQWVFWRDRSIIELTSVELVKCSLNWVSMHATVSSRIYCFFKETFIKLNKLLPPWKVVGFFFPFQILPFH